MSKPNGGYRPTRATVTATDCRDCGTDISRYGPGPNLGIGGRWDSYKSIKRCQRCHAQRAAAKGGGAFAREHKPALWQMIFIEDESLPIMEGNDK